MSGTNPLFRLDRVLGDDILGDEETARLNDLLTDLSEALDDAGVQLEEVLGNVRQAAEDAGLDLEELLDRAREAAEDVVDGDDNGDDGGNGNGGNGDGGNGDAGNGDGNGGDGPASETGFAILLPENNSGALGFAAVTLTGDTLDLAAVVDNVAPGVPHPFHIHGFTDDRTERTATIAEDTDGDGYVETAEGAEAIGPVLAALTTTGDADPAGAGEAAYPSASAEGRVVMLQSYQLDTGDAAEAGILAALEEQLYGRFLQMHGAEIPEGAGEGTPGEVDGTGGYVPIVPVAAGQLLMLPAEVEQLFESDPAALLDGITAFLSAIAPYTLKADGSGPIGVDPLPGPDGGEEGSGDDADDGEGNGANGEDGDDVGGGGTGDDAGNGTGDVGANGNGGIGDGDNGANDDDGNGADGDNGNGNGNGDNGNGMNGGEPSGDGAAQRFVSLLLPTNNSGVFGAAEITFDRSAGTVAVDLDLRGLEPGQEHAIHIHGFTDDSPSLLPNLTLDADLDGFVEPSEAASVVGPTLLGITADGSISDATLTADFPEADGDGYLSLEQTYSFDLDDPAQATLFGELQDRMEGRQLQVHGLTVGADQGEGTTDVVEGEAGYQPLLAVANGAILSADDPGGQFAATLATLVEATIEAQSGMGGMAPAPTPDAMIA